MARRLNKEEFIDKINGVDTSDWDELPKEDCSYRDEKGMCCAPKRARCEYACDYGEGYICMAEGAYL